MILTGIVAFVVAVRVVVPSPAVLGGREALTLYRVASCRLRGRFRLAVVADDARRRRHRTGEGGAVGECGDFDEDDHERAESETRVEPKPRSHGGPAARASEGSLHGSGSSRRSASQRRVRRRRKRERRGGAPPRRPSPPTTSSSIHHERPDRGHCSCCHACSDLQAQEATRPGSISRPKASRRLGSTGRGRRPQGLDQVRPCFFP